MPLDLLKFIHVLAAIIWVGGVLATVLMASKYKSVSSASGRDFTRATNFLGSIYGPVIVLLLATGIWMIVDDRTPWAFSQLWVSIGLTGFTISLILGIAFHMPQGKALEAELAADNPAAQTRLDRIRLVGNIDALILVVVVWAMVMKPGL